MSNPRDFRRAIDAALGDEVPRRGEGLQDWLAPTQETRVEQVAAADIAEPDWRAPVDAADPTFRALKASIRASGILQPLLLRRLPGGGLQVVSGMRRLRAARDTGQDAVPATVRDLSDVQAIVGAWDAVVRESATTARRDAIERGLLGGGMPSAEASALIASLLLVEGGAGAPAAGPPRAAEFAVEEAQAAAPDPETVAGTAPAMEPVEEQATPVARVEEPAPVAEPAEVAQPAPEPAEVAQPAPEPVSPVGAAPAPAEQASAPAAPEAATASPEAPPAVPETESGDGGTGAGTPSGASSPVPAGYLRRPPAPWSPPSWKARETPSAAPDSGVSEEPASGADPARTATEPEIEPVDAPGEAATPPGGGEPAEDHPEKPAPDAPEPRVEPGRHPATGPPPWAWSPRAPRSPQPNPGPPAPPEAPPAEHPPWPLAPAAKASLDEYGAPQPPSAGPPAATAPLLPAAPATPAAAAPAPPTAPAPSLPLAPAPAVPAAAAPSPAEEPAPSPPARTPWHRVTGTAAPPGAPPAWPPALSTTRSAALPVPQSPALPTAPSLAIPAPPAAAPPAPWAPATEVRSAPTAPPPSQRPGPAPIQPAEPAPWRRPAPAVSAPGPHPPATPVDRVPAAPQLPSSSSDASETGSSWQPPPKSQVISIELPRPVPAGDDRPSEPVVLAPRPGQPRRLLEDEPVTALPRSAGRPALAQTLVDWRTGATVGTFVFVLCVVYVILIVLLGEKTLLVPALVVALLGMVTAVVSMVRSRRTP